MPELVGDMEKFAHNDRVALPELLRIAIIHYQFETIHPFCDGNGRVDRLLIPIYLVEKGLLKRPALYIYDFFERNRKLYYDNLTSVRTDSNLRQWIRFFLVGIVEAAQKGAETFDAILKLQRECEDKINSLRGKAYSARTVSLYKQPFVTAFDVAEITGKTPASAYKLIEDLARLNILVEITGGKRGKCYVFKGYLTIYK